MLLEKGQVVSAFVCRQHILDSPHVGFRIRRSFFRRHEVDPPDRTNVRSTEEGTVVTPMVVAQTNVSVGRRTSSLCLFSIILSTGSVASKVCMSRASFPILGYDRSDRAKPDLLISLKSPKQEQCAHKTITKRHVSFPCKTHEFLSFSCPTSPFGC